MDRYRFFVAAAVMTFVLRVTPGIAASPSDFDATLITDTELTRTYTQLIVVSRITPDLVRLSLAPCRRANATQSALVDATIARWKGRNDADVVDVNALAQALGARMIESDGEKATQVFKIIEDMTTGASAERLKLKVVMAAWDSLSSALDESCAQRYFALDNGKMDIRTNQATVWDIVQRAPKK